MRREIREAVKKFLAPIFKIAYQADDFVSISLRQLKHAIKSKGRDYLIAHYTGVKISRSEAIEAHCCKCMGYYVDGKKDCEVKPCEFYRWMPYGSMVKRSFRKAK